MAKIEYIKTIIHGDAELRQELLVGVLRNILYGRRYFAPPVDILKQHNRDIYYIVGGPTEARESWTDPHLIDDEREKLKVVPVEEVLSRMTDIPEWWPGS